MITVSDKNKFEGEGFLRLPGLIPAPMLQILREFFDECMDPAGSNNDRALYEYNGNCYITNLENLCRHENHSCLELLGFPPILELAQDICGDDFFLIQEFAVIKNKGDEHPVLWHQDMVHERKGKCFTMGIYLDDAPEHDGALRVVPGSHLTGKSICELSRLPFQEAPMQAGDILIHDMMLAHCSEPMRHHPVRRVIYFEFLSAAHVAAEKIYSPELVERRRRLTYLAIRYYQEKNPGNPVFKPALPAPVPADAARPLNEVLAEIYIEPVRARPSSYCLEFR